MMNIYPKDVKNSLYKCHFCQQNIDVYGIEKHFATFHKFRSSIKSDYVCEFCDDFEEFHSQANLFHHIQNTHNLMNDEKIQKEANVNTLEEGKSRFLQLIINFNSQEDVFNLLQWIKFNDTNSFMNNHQEIENEVLVLEENVSETTKEDDDEENILHDDIDNTDSNAVIDFDHETDEILTQRDFNTFMTENLGNENELMVDVHEENINKTTAENDENILLKDMDNTDLNSIGDLDQETDVILIQREIVHGQESSDEEAFEEDFSNRSSKSDKTIHTDKNHDGKYLFHKGHKDHNCESCGKSFSKAGNLKNHIHTFHEGHKDYKCESCGKSFSVKEYLRKHIHRIHVQQGNKNYKCDSCGKSFTTSYYMKSHINVIHDRHEGHKCDSCSKSFLTLQSLERHLHAVHDGSKDQKCEYCGKYFSLAQNLKTHIHTVHEGHKDYKCESCGKSFSHSYNMMTHIHTVHKGHKDHKCNSCGKSFSHAGDLKKHIHTVHDGHKDHKCGSCSKSFTLAGSLKRHIHTVHDGHRDYKCESCGKSFSQPTHLKKHIHIVHEGHKDTN